MWKDQKKVLNIQWPFDKTDLIYYISKAISFEVSFSPAARHTFTNKTRQNRFCHILFAMRAYRYSNITFIFSMNISQSMYEIISFTLYICIYNTNVIIRELHIFQIYKRITNKILCQQKSSLIMRLCCDLATQ